MTKVLCKWRDSYYSEKWYDGYIIAFDRGAWVVDDHGKLHCPDINSIVILK